MPKGTPLTEEEQFRKRAEIMDITTRLFAEKGFLETSMREIAEATGMGKSTLYDYFKTKDDILVSYFENEINAITALVEEIDKTNAPAVEKLRQTMIAHLDYLLANKTLYLKLTIEAQRLGMESQKRIQISRHAYQDMVCKMIEDGIKEGSFRPVDPMLTMRIVLGALNPVVFTTRPTGSPHEMLNAAIDILLKGILS